MLSSGGIGGRGPALRRTSLSDKHAHQPRAPPARLARLGIDTQEVAGVEHAAKLAKNPHDTV